MDIDQLGRNVEERVDLVGAQVRPQLAKARERLRSLDGRARTLIKEHPAACLLGALGLGYLFARLARRHL
jgi:hypothetical protein